MELVSKVKASLVNKSLGGITSLTRKQKNLTAFTILAVLGFIFVLR